LSGGDDPITIDLRVRALIGESAAYGAQPSGRAGHMQDEARSSRRTAYSIRCRSGSRWKSRWSQCSMGSG